MGVFRNENPTARSLRVTQQQGKRSKVHPDGSGRGTGQQLPIDLKGYDS